MEYKYEFSENSAQKWKVIIPVIIQSYQSFVREKDQSHYSLKNGDNIPNCSWNVHESF